MSRGCSWLKNGLYIETYTRPDFNDPVSHDLGLKSCCRIYHYKDTKGGANAVFPFKKYQENKNNPNYNYENLKQTSCLKCFNEEKTHGSSMRTRSPSFDHLEGGDIKQLQLTFSSFCNLKCKYCSSANSTAWNDDVPYSEGTMKLGITKEQTFDHETKVINFLESTDLSGLKMLGVFGGEPFMARKFGEFMEMLDRKCDISRVMLQINTNATIFPKGRILDIMKQFGRVDLRLSNESIGNLSEYIRNGSKWEDFERNSIKWMEESIGNGIDVKLHAAHNVWSLNKVEDFYNWAIGAGIPLFNASTPTPYYSNVAAVLTPQQRKECINILESMPKGPTKVYVQNLLKTDSWDSKHKQALREFKQFTRLFDSRTPYTLQEVNPELYAWTHKQ